MSSHTPKQHTEDFMLNRLMWKAGKYGLPSACSFYFKDLSPAMQQVLYSYIDTGITGQPVLFFTKPTSEWTLICTRQVIGNNNSSTFAISLSDIGSVRASVFAGTDTAVEKLHVAKRQPKGEWHTLDVTGRSGNSYVLHANKGSDLFALWNILLMVTRLSPGRK